MVETQRSVHFNFTGEGMKLLHTVFTRFFFWCFQWNDESPKKSSENKVQNPEHVIKSQNILRI